MMRPLWGVLACVAALTAGCAGAPSQQQPVPAAQATHPNHPDGGQPALATTPSAGDGAGGYVDQLFADPRLDPIRDKVPLVLRSGAVTPRLLANEDRPTVTEKQSIKVWMSIREQAQQYQLEHRGPPSPLLVRTRQLVTRAILQLYGGDLTYGEFAKRIQILDSEYQAAARQVRQ